MAPIQFLPFDILGLIFKNLVFNGSQTDPFTALTAWMLVCRSWHNAVVGHPALWGCISIMPQEFIPKPDRHGRVPPVVRVNIQLSRSCNALLDIRVGFPDSGTIHDTCARGVYSTKANPMGIGHNIEDCPEVKDRYSYLQLLLKTLAGHEGKNMKRWRSFTFCQHEHRLLAEYCDLSVLYHSAPQLQNLVLSDWAHPSLFKEVPQLTYIYLPSYNGAISLAHGMPSVMEICMVMGPDREIHPGSVFQLLSQCSTLRRATISDSLFTISQLQAEPKALVKLSSLRHLAVESGILFDHVLATLDLPNVVSLVHIDGGDSVHRDVRSCGPWNKWVRNIQHLIFDSFKLERPRVQVLRRLLDEAQRLEVLSVDDKTWVYVEKMLDADHGLCPSLLKLQIISHSDRTHNRLIAVPFPTRLAVPNRPIS
jgi:hypothetical protein